MQLHVSRARGVGLNVGCMPLPWCCNHRACCSAWICCIHMCARLWHVVGKCPWQKRWWIDANWHRRRSKRGGGRSPTYRASIGRWSSPGETCPMSFHRSMRRRYLIDVVHAQLRDGDELPIDDHAVMIPAKDRPQRVVRKRSREKRYLLGRWAPQADPTSTSSPPLRDKRGATRADETSTSSAPLRHKRNNAKRQRPHVRGRSKAPARAPQAPPGSVPPWAWGSSGIPNLNDLTPMRHNVKTTTAARAWASLGASPGAANATRRCTSLGVGLHKPTKPQRSHPHLATSASTRERQHRKAHSCHHRVASKGYPLG